MKHIHCIFYEFRTIRICHTTPKRLAINGTSTAAAVVVVVVVDVVVVDVVFVIKDK